MSEQEERKVAERAITESRRAARDVSRSPSRSMIAAMAAGLPAFNAAFDASSKEVADVVIEVDTSRFTALVESMRARREARRAKHSPSIAWQKAAAPMPEGMRLAFDESYTFSADEWDELMPKRDTDTDHTTERKTT